jgi:integrase
VRRPWGTGSVFQRKDGRWIGSVESRDGSGRRRRRYVSGPSEAVVKRRLREMEKSSTSRRGSESVGAYLRRWLDEVAAKRLRARTLESYTQLAETWIIPPIGGIRLRDLGPDDVQRMLAAIPRKPQTVSHARKVLSSALQHALRLELVDRNVARLVPAPRIERKDVDAWTADEARAFLKAVRDDDWYALYVLALTTGMRQGEILGLRWSDVDLKAGTVRVSQTLRQLDRYRWKPEEPKTKSSRRTLSLPKVAIEALRAHPRGIGLVFCRPDGRPLPRAEVTRQFQEKAVAAGLRRITFHQIRHTAAVLLLDRSGGDLRMAQSVLGHSSIQTTVDVYGGRAAVARERAAAIMDDILADTEAV